LSVEDLKDLTVNGQKGERTVAPDQHAAEDVWHAAGAISLLYVRIPGPFIKSGGNLVLLRNYPSKAFPEASPPLPDWAGGPVEHAGFRG